MKIKFLGAAGTVTGSSYCLTSNSGQSILIDLGMFQGSKELEELNYPNLDIDCTKLSGMLLTHAHLDHCGRIPTLPRQGFKQSIFMTAPTLDLTEISLLDSAKINKEDRKEKQPLYEKSDVETILEQFRTVEFEKPFSIGGFLVTYREAGHILGSASIEIVDEETKQKIVFSGDLGNTPEDLIRPTEMISEGDFVVMESTYGDTTHPGENPSNKIQSEINIIEQTGGTLLIPAFSIERSQELLHRIAHLKKLGKVKLETPVFFDSPMGEKATHVFQKYQQFYNDELKKDLLVGDPFSFPGLTVVENREDGKKVSQTMGPKIIIAGSGMMTGGRILGHAANFLPQPTTRLLIVGYQAEETLGRALLEGEKNVSIEGRPINVRALVSETQAMSSHADQPRLLKWLSQIKGVRKVFLTHGENGPRKALLERIKSDLKIDSILLPNHNDLDEVAT